MVTDWYSKRHKVTQVEAEVVLDDQKAVWHAVSYDYHDNFQGKADLTCGNGTAIIMMLARRPACMAGLAPHVQS